MARLASTAPEEISDEDSCCSSSNFEGPSSLLEGTQRLLDFFSPRATTANFIHAEQLWNWLCRLPSPRAYLTEAIKSSGPLGKLDSTTIEYLLDLSSGNTETEQRKRRAVVRIFSCWQIFPWQLTSAPPPVGSLSKPLLENLCKFGQEGCDRATAERALERALHDRIEAPRAGIGRGIRATKHLQPIDVQKALKSIELQGPIEESQRNLFALKKRKAAVPRPQTISNPSAPAISSAHSDTNLSNQPLYVPSGVVVQEPSSNRTSPHYHPKTSTCTEPEEPGTRQQLSTVAPGAGNPQQEVVFTEGHHTIGSLIPAGDAHAQVEQEQGRDGDSLNFEDEGLGGGFGSDVGDEEEAPSIEHGRSACYQLRDSSTGEDSDFSPWLDSSLRGPNDSWTYSFNAPPQRRSRLLTPHATRSPSPRSAVPRYTEAGPSPRKMAPSIPESAKDDELLLHTEACQRDFAKELRSFTHKVRNFQLQLLQKNAVAEEVDSEQDQNRRIILENLNAQEIKIRVLESNIDENYKEQDKHKDVIRNWQKQMDITQRQHRGVSDDAEETSTVVSNAGSVSGDRSPRSTIHEKHLAMLRQQRGESETALAEAVLRMSQLRIELASAKQAAEIQRSLRGMLAGSERDHQQYPGLAKWEHSLDFIAQLTSMLEASTFSGDRNRHTTKKLRQ